MNQRFIIIEGSALVAEDIREALSDRFPEAEIAVHDALPDALAAFDDQRPVAAVIANWPYADLVHSALDAEAARSGARIIVTRGVGKDEEIVPKHWIRLPAPFTTEIIIAALS